MQDNTTTTTKKPEALSRTWRTHNTAEMDGAVISASRHTVTLSRAFVGGPLSAEVDGQTAELAYAVGLLEDAWKTEVLAEDLAPLPAPAIGKARAHRLHKLLGSLPVDHYGIAGRALGRDVQSLATLTEAEARQVWRFVCHMFPTFRQVAA